MTGVEKLRTLQRVYSVTLSMLDKSIDIKKKKKNKLGAYLVVQGIRICLPTQGTQIQALIQEDPTCPGTTKPTNHNY